MPPRLSLLPLIVCLSYVVLVASSSFFLAFWHGARVTSYRQPAGVAYPNAYAVSTGGKPLSQAEYLFNCAQRAHGNYLENHTSFVAALLLAGLRYPIASAIIGLGWCVSRVLFAIGYTRTDKDKGQGRLVGLGFWLCQLALFGMTAKIGYDMLMS